MENSLLNPSSRRVEGIEADTLFELEVGINKFLKGLEAGKSGTIHFQMCGVGGTVKYSALIEYVDTE